MERAWAVHRNVTNTIVFTCSLSKRYSMVAMDANGMHSAVLICDLLTHNYIMASQECVLHNSCCYVTIRNIVLAHCISVM